MQKAGFLTTRLIWYSPSKPKSLCSCMDNYKKVISWETQYEPISEVTCLRGFRPDLTQTGLNSHRRWLEARNFGKKNRGSTIYVVKTKALIRCAVTTQLICASVFTYAKIRFSGNAANIQYVMFCVYHSRPYVKDIFQSISAKVGKEPCCDWVSWLVKSLLNTLAKSFFHAQLS